MKKIIFTFSLLCFFYVTNAQNNTFFVHTNATGTGSGTSWADAFNHITAALEQAQYGDTVWVAAGTYKPTSDLNRDSSFHLKNGVKLFGGFFGTETQLSQRNIQLYPTILSGDIGIPGNASDNCYNVMTGTDADSTTVVDGFTIERGNANSTANNDPKTNRKRGGGLYLKPKIAGHDVSPTLKNCLFKYNYAEAGSAIYADGNNLGRTTPALNACRFEHNSIGMSVFYNCAKVNALHKLDIRNNFWGYNNNGGVVIFHTRGDVEIEMESDTFSNPISLRSIIVSGTSTAGGLTCHINKNYFGNNNEARLDLFEAQTLVPHSYLIENCKFINNSHVNIYTELSPATYLNNTFSNNPNVYIEGLEPINLSNNKFDNSNYVSIQTKNTQVTNNTFKNISRLTWDINAEAIEEARTDYNQNLFYNVRLKNNAFKQATFQNCTFLNTRGFSDTSSLFFPYDSLVFNSCIFSNYSLEAPIVNATGASPSKVLANNCVFESTCEGILPGADAAFCNGNNLFEAALLFYDTAAGDYRLRPCSPGINRGDPVAMLNAGISTDLNNTPRIANGLPDAGAFETEIIIHRDSVYNAICDGTSNGAITYSSDACTPFVFSWMTDTGETGTQVDQLSAGLYYITLTDVNEVSFLDTVTIEEIPVAFTVNAGLISASSSSAANGTIHLEVVAGGTAPFQYLWSNGMTGPLIENLSLGVYSVTIIDANGCSNVYSFDLSTVNDTEPSLLGSTLFPNPAKAGQALHVKGEGKPILITLIDLTGKKWAQTNQQSLLIPENTPAGIYLVKIEDRSTGQNIISKIFIE